MHRVEATQIPFTRERGGVFDERLIDFHDAERRPFIRHRVGRGAAGSNADRPHGPDEAHAADESTAGIPHRGAHRFADAHLLVRPTAHKIALSEPFSSRTPISRMRSSSCR